MNNKPNTNTNMDYVGPSDADSDNDLACELCGRREVKLTRHHLIPRARHNKKRTQRHFSRGEMVGEIAMLCRACHSQVHRTFDNHQLANHYHTVQRLKEHSEMDKFIKWIKKRPAGLKIRVR